MRIVLSQGQSSDKTVAPILLKGLKPKRDLIADRGYDARAIIDLVESRGGRAHIPTCRDRKVQQRLLLRRGKVLLFDATAETRTHVRVVTRLSVVGCQWSAVD